MKYIANSRFDYAGKTYFPGQALPKAPQDVVEKWIAKGYAVPDKSVKQEEKKKNDGKKTPAEEEQQSIDGNLSAEEAE